MRAAGPLPARRMFLECHRHRTAFSSKSSKLGHPPSRHPSRLRRQSRRSFMGRRGPLPSSSNSFLRDWYLPVAVRFLSSPLFVLVISRKVLCRILTIEPSGKELTRRRATRDVNAQVNTRETRLSIRRKNTTPRAGSGGCNPSAPVVQQFSACHTRSTQSSARMYDEIRMAVGLRRGLEPTVHIRGLSLRSAFRARRRFTATHPAPHRHQ